MKFLVFLLAIASFCQAASVVVVAPSKDLSASDFALTVAGKPQVVTDAHLEEHSVVVLVFSTSEVHPKYHSDLRRQLHAFVDATARPNRVFAVVTSSGRIKQVQSFTADAAAVKEGVDQALNGKVTTKVNCCNSGDLLAGLLGAIEPMSGTKSVFTIDNGLPKPEIEGADNFYYRFVGSANLRGYLAPKQIAIHQVLYPSPKAANNNIVEHMTKALAADDTTYTIHYTPTGNPKGDCIKASVTASGAAARLRSLHWFNGEEQENRCIVVP